MGRNPISTTRLLDYIESRILAGEYSPGEVLPSVRRFAAKFKLSYGTTYRAFERLCENGVLEQKPNHGFFVRRSPLRRNDGGRQIFVFMETSANPAGGGMMYHALLGARDVGEPAGFELSVVDRHCGFVSTDFFREASRQCDGMLLLSAYDWYLADFESACPAVGMLMLNSYGGRLSTVNADLYDTAKKAVDYFLNCGVNRVVLFSSPKPIYRQRGRLFFQAWNDLGGRAEFVDVISPANYDFQPGCGYFFTSDDWFNYASCAYCERTGRRLEQDFPVLSADGKHQISPDYPAFPTITFDWRELGRLAMEELLRRIHSPESRARNLSLCGTLSNYGSSVMLDVC